MNNLKRISLAGVLMFTLGTNAMAGITECPPVVPPPPPSESVAATGIIESPPSVQGTSDASDSEIDLTFTVLQIVLSVF